MVTARPSDKAVERFISDITTTISTNKKSQRELIITLNQKLKGWAGYHRCTEAKEAFIKVDTAVQTALLDSARKQYPRLPIQKVKTKFWYKAPDGRYFYALPDDKTIRVVRLEDTLLITHNRINTSINPFLDKDYFENKTHDREIQNVTGKYRSLWERQDGKCYYCGKYILKDQRKALVQIDLSIRPSVLNSAYIHERCALSEFEILQTARDITYMRPYDVSKILEEIADGHSKEVGKKEITPKWKYYALKQYFANCRESFITLTFSEIENILHFSLPRMAFNNRTWWIQQHTKTCTADAWESENYVINKLYLKDRKVSFRRIEEKVSRLHIPQELLNSKLPDDLIYEFEQHCDYLVKKYGLKK